MTNPSGIYEAKAFIGVHATSQTEADILIAQAVDRANDFLGDATESAYISLDDSPAEILE